MTTQSAVMRKKRHKEIDDLAPLHKDLIVRLQEVQQELRPQSHPRSQPLLPTDRVAQEVFEILAQATYDRYDAAEIQSWVEASLASGGSYPKFNSRTIIDLSHISIVPTMPLRERALLQIRENRASWNSLVVEVTRILKGLEAEHKANFESSVFVCQRATEALGRTLGYIMCYNYTGNTYKIWTEYFKAVAIAEALGMAPHEAGV